MAKSFKKVALKFADDVISGKKIAGKEIILACERFKKDLQRDDLELRTTDPDFAINIMQNILVHQQGEDLDGKPLQGKPFILEPWQVFIVYNLLGFYYKGTDIKRYKEGFIEVARKNGKTSLIAALSFAISVLMRHSGSKTYIVASALRQTLEAFHFLTFSLHYRGLDKKMTIKDNSFEHSIKYMFGNNDGSMEIIAMPTNPDAQDSFNCNFVIADEVASYKKPAQYNRFKEATAAYANSLCLSITTAGDNINGFGYAHQEYCLKVIQGLVQDDQMFVFIARADQDDKGQVDYTNPVQHQKANLNYGVTIRPDEILQASLQAQNDPLKRKDFLSRRLNIYTASMKSWFDIEMFRQSDRKYNWTLEELSKMDIAWYGGADLSRSYDLTAACLFGNYQGVDIIIAHGFFPVTQAAVKSEEDHIPLWGWMDDGWLTMCNSQTVNMADVVNWFVSMRQMGFKIKEVGHDRKFAGEEYFPQMRRAGFRVIDQPQYFYLKSQGFRHIEKSAMDGNLYYLHSEAYEYCVSNVHAVEKTDDAVQYEKINPTQRIDLFDASVFACIRYAEAESKAKVIKDWFN
jgi:phage terminase large subunit-like protein